MHKLLILISLLSFISVHAAVEDNVVINDRSVNYKLKASKGRLSSVKIEDNTQYLANRADDKIYATAFYGNGITVDKASAPDAKPIYRSWEDGDEFFTGSRICALPVSLKKGSPVKVVFERTYTQPEQFTDVMLVKPGYKTINSTYRFYVPAELSESICLTPHNLPEGVEMTKEAAKNGDIVYTINIKDNPPFKRERLSASSETFAPRVQVSGYFADTNELYNYLHSKVNDDEQSEKVAQFTRTLCEGLESEIAKIDTIASWVRNNIRYVAIEHGEYGMRPDDAESVFDKRYGDCKGSANLIRVMLNSVGIDGRLVWIGTEGDVTGSWTDKPSLAAGNHMIAAAVLPDTTIFIDGTITNAPKGLIPSSIAGQECMIQNGDKCIISRVGEQTPGISKLVLTGNLTVGPKGLEGLYEADYWGQDRMALENTLAGMSAPKRKSVLQLILSFDRKGVTPENPVVTTGGDNSSLSKVTYTETDPSAVRTLSSGKTYLQPRPFRAASYPRLDVKERRSPIDLGRKKSFETHLVCNIPDEYTIETLPERMTIDSPWFTGFVEYSLAEDGKAVVCDAALNCIKSVGGADEIERWNEAVKEIEKASGTPVILTKVQNNE
ncbi:MAG: transglutaminase-like domain-containing protein [Muribaculaceae bacterium]|nr:transglutaminase-like domain-containing protein [Muribaculaceae bacterium]